MAIYAFLPFFFSTSRQPPLQVVDVTIDICASLVAAGVSFSESKLFVECARLLPPISCLGMSYSVCCYGMVVFGTNAEQFCFSSFCQLCRVLCSLGSRLFLRYSTSWNMLFVVVSVFSSSYMSSADVAENCHPFDFCGCLLFLSFLFCGHALCR